MSTEAMLLLLVIILIGGFLPLWPYNRSWGYVPLGALTLILVFFVFWACAATHPLIKKSNIQEELKESGRAVAGSIRQALQ